MVANSKFSGHSETEILDQLKEKGVDPKKITALYTERQGFDFTVLSEFRDRVAEGARADRLLALFVDRLAEAGLVRRRGRIRTDSTHVPAAVRRLNRGELVAETLRCALEDLALQGVSGDFPPHKQGRP
ncbi:hypothetical protein OG819_04985 [Streptomyces sp. NBC_01549]|nr:hypothetical protein [Streptomyces sp. NBC_01549]